MRKLILAAMLSMACLRCNLLSPGGGPGAAAGDLNGDGNLDLLTDSWGDDRVAVLLGDGKGGFQTGPILTVGKHPYQRVRIADVNGDGKDDILTTNLEGDNVTVLLGDGKG